MFYSRIVNRSNWGAKRRYKPTRKSLALTLLLLLFSILTFQAPGEIKSAVANGSPYPASPVIQSVSVNHSSKINDGGVDSNVATVSAQVSSFEQTDPFGIDMFYPTAARGLTWDSRHWNNGRFREIKSSDSNKWDPDDPTGFSRLSGNSKLVFHGNGIMSMEKNTSSDSGPRIYIDPAKSSGKFANTELTVYARLVKGTLASNGGIIVGARSGPDGHTSSGDHCFATTYYGRYLAGGSVNFYKELVHATESDPRTTQGRGPNQEALGNSWVGFKYVIYDLPNGHVKFELYVDRTNGANGGNWQLVTEYTDTGDWWSDDDEMSKCVSQGKRTGPTEIITGAKGNGVSLLRQTWVASSNPVVEYKWMSVREIDPTPTPSKIVSNLTVASGRPYQVMDDGLASDALFFIDRNFTFKSVPGSVVGSTYIKTANDDKGRTDTSFLSFQINQDVTVYVAYDHRATSLPNWLKGWNNTGESITTTDTNFNLFAKGFAASNTVTLGGNLAAGAAGARSNYFVVFDVVTSVNTVADTAIVSPQEGASFLSTDTIDFIGSATDLEDGDLSEGALVWTSNLDGQIGTGGTAKAALSAGVHIITLTATDGRGASGSDTVSITVVNLVYGDANRDGEFTGEDIHFVVDWIVGRQPIPPNDTPAFVAADVNADGVVDATDVDLMISRYLGKIDRFPAEP